MLLCNIFWKSKPIENKLLYTRQSNFFDFLMIKKTQKNKKNKKKYKKKLHHYCLPGYIDKKKLSKTVTNCRILK